MLEYSFTIVYHPGRLNSVVNALTHCSAISAPTANFEAIKNRHESMGHLGAIRLHACMLPFHKVSRNDILEATGRCKLCAEVKLQFFRPPLGKFMQATSSWQCTSIDFVGSKASHTRSRYLFTVIDASSLYPFAFPVPNQSIQTV